METSVRLHIHYCTVIRAIQKNCSVGISGNMLFIQDSWLKVQILINLVCSNKCAKKRPSRRLPSVQNSRYFC